MVVKELLPNNGGRTLPLVITPKNEEVDLTDWVKTNKAQFEQELLKHGALLLRGFNIISVESFNTFMTCFDTAPLPYMFRSSPRKEVNRSVKNIYQSTTYPNNRSINMHNESSYSRIWAQKIVFCCIRRSVTGGETPIADSRRILADIRPSLTDKFRRLGVRYKRNLFPDLGMPWQEVFQTEDMEVVKTICERYNIQYRFEADDRFVIEWVKSAICKHPVTNEETWFNHVFFFNKYARYEELGMSKDDELDEEYLTSDTFYGDGSSITYDEYQELKNAYEKNKVVFPYENGDVLFLDNMLTAHGRNPYTGDRLIATALVEAVFENENGL